MGVTGRSFVMPAKAGTQGAANSIPAVLDPRFRGGDEEEKPGTKCSVPELVEMVDPGGIAAGDLSLLRFRAVLQNLLNDLPAPGEGGLDMGII
jgi:hypothetical protein